MSAASTKDIEKRNDLNISLAYSQVLSIIDPKVKFAFGFLSSLYTYGKTHSANMSNFLAQILPGALTYPSLKYRIGKFVAEPSRKLSKWIGGTAVVAYNNCSGNYQRKYSREAARKKGTAFGEVFTSVAGWVLTKAEDEFGDWPSETVNALNVQSFPQFGPSFWKPLHMCPFNEYAEAMEAAKRMVEGDNIAEIDTALHEEDIAPCVVLSKETRNADGIKEELKNLIKFGDSDGKTKLLDTKMCKACMTKNTLHTRTCLCGLALGPIEEYRLAQEGEADIMETMKTQFVMFKTRKKDKAHVEEMEKAFVQEVVEGSEDSDGPSGSNRPDSAQQRRDHLSYNVKIKSMELEREVWAAILLNPNKEVTIRAVVDEIGKRYCVEGFRDEDEIERNWLFIVADLGAVNDKMFMPDGGETYRVYRERIAPLLGLFHAYAACHKMVFTLAWISGSATVAGYHYGKVTPKATRWLGHANDLHKSNDYLLYVCLPAYRAAFLTEYLATDEAKERGYVDILASGLSAEHVEQITNIRESFMAWLYNEAHDGDATFTSQRQLWFEIVPALHLFKKAIRNDDVLVADAAMNLLVPLLIARGHNHYAKAIPRDWVRYNHSAPTAVRNARRYCAWHEGSPIDERQEEVNRELKHAGTLNSEMGVMFASSFLDTLQEAQTHLHRICDLKTPEKKDRTEYDLREDTTRVTRALYHLSYVKPGGADGERKDLRTPLGKVLRSNGHLKELCELGMDTLQQKWHSILTYDASGSIISKKKPICNEDRAYAADEKGGEEPEEEDTVEAQANNEIQVLQEAVVGLDELGDAQGLVEVYHEGYIESKGADAQCTACELYYPNDPLDRWHACGFCPHNALVWYCDKDTCAQNLLDHENTCIHRPRRTV